MSSEYDSEEIARRVNQWLMDNIKPYYLSERQWIPEMVWIDSETTGLDPNHNVLIELGIMLTDKDGNPGPNSIFSSIIRPDAPVVWEGVDPFVQEMHQRSHLAQDLAKSDDLEMYSSATVENTAMSFLRSFFGETVSGLYMAGSSVHFDHKWIETRMPELAKLFSYRILDVSSLRIVSKIRNNIEYDPDYKPMMAHRVIPDLVDSIEEYRFLVKSLKEN